jgi:hypothetical protein
MPLANPSTLDRAATTGCASGERSSYVEGLWSPSLVRVPENRRRKHTLIRSAIFRLARRGSFSLRRGLDSIYVVLELRIILFSCSFASRNDEGDLSGSPSLQIRSVPRF